jgi:hypothetical protein
LSKPRYYNLLLSAWERRYGGERQEEGRRYGGERREEGMAVLERFCQDGYHLQLPGKSDQGQYRLETEGDDKGNVNFLSVPESKLESVDALYLEDLRPHPAKTSSDPGKKLKTVVGKPFNVKTVSPGASR